MVQMQNSTKYVADKDRKAFANDLKTMKKWTMPVRNRGKVYGELAVMFDGRLPESPGERYCGKGGKGS